MLVFLIARLGIIGLIFKRKVNCLESYLIYYLPILNRMGNFVLKEIYFEKNKIDLGL